MDKFEIAKSLMSCFPNSFINHNGDFIAHEKSNTYLIIDNCESLLDVKCKVLEWFSRAAHKTQPYVSERTNKKFHEFMLSGINQFLGTSFTEDDMDVIYTYLGNCVNHALTIDFVKSGYDMQMLKKRLTADARL